MPTQVKLDVVDELKEKLEKSHIAIATKYIGINAGQVTELRRRLRDSRIQFKVYKNTLMKRALDELNLSDAAEYMNGPTAWAFSEDPVAPARILKEFNKEVALVEMNGGILEGKPVSKERLNALASLPPKEVLIAQVVGTIAAPLQQFVGVLSALPRNLVYALDQIRKQKEGAAA